ncbi:hypothetical protein ACFU9B_18140 [Streptomyces sp. NPDC057592]|uniref:hypothetical protein n=1 Tax=Streptomyces sp. NPDC057592 TaxID=3346175 RepID=UPI0036850799
MKSRTHARRPEGTGSVTDVSQALGIPRPKGRTPAASARTLSEIGRISESVRITAKNET